MIVVQEIIPGMFTRIYGNPVILSLDKEVQAPLRTILAPSWTEEDRAKFGIFIVEPVVVPPGKIAIGNPWYERQNGKVVELYELRDALTPQPRSDAHARA